MNTKLFKARFKMAINGDYIPLVTKLITDLRAKTLEDIKTEEANNGMYLDANNTWRMKCGCTEANVLDNNHNVCNKNFGAK